MMFSAVRFDVVQDQLTNGAQFCTHKCRQLFTMLLSLFYSLLFFVFSFYANFFLYLLTLTFLNTHAHTAHRIDACNLILFVSHSCQSHIYTERGVTKATTKRL